MKWLVIVCLIAFSQESARAQFVLLNEYGGNQDEANITWVEVYNPTQETQELLDCKLQFEGEDLFISIPNVTIAPLSYYVFDFQLTPVSINPSVNIYHDENTADLNLLNAFNGTISSLNWVCVPAGTSYGLTGGFPSQAHFNTPTPTAENGTNWSIIQKQGIELSHPSGFYNQATIDIIPTPETNFTYHYTLEGEEVDTSSLEWPSAGLLLTAENANETTLSHIIASDYQVPTAGPQDVAHTLSLRAFMGTCPVSDISRHTYFIGQEPLGGVSIPIFSISTTDDHLFGDYGIYGFGITGENFVYRSIGWERPATISYFDEQHELQLEQNVGIRIRGNGSRYFPQKSLKIYARSEYDEETWMRNVFFPNAGIEEMKRLVLRSPTNDFLASMLSDQLSMQLVSDMNIDAPSAKSCALFLNGEFWGIYSLQESLDQFYPESHYDIDDDEVEVAENPWEGSYSDVVGFVQSHDLSVQENFDQLADMMDMPSMIDYYSAQVFLANSDWPAKNLKLWFSEDDDDDDQTRGRYYFFDCDACFKELNLASLNQFYPETSNLPYNVIFSSSLQNDNFRRAYFTRILELLKTDFSVETAMEKLELEEEILSPTIDFQVSRWGAPQSREAWLASIESIRQFILLRQFKVREFLEEHMDYSIRAYPNPCRPGEKITLDSHEFLDEDVAFELVNLMGNIVQVGSAQEAQITIGNLQDGVYILRTESQGFLLQTRIVVID